MPQLIIAIIIIAAAIAIIKILFVVFVMCSVDLLALFDRMLGSLTNNTALSWAISGFMIGTLTYFVFIEARKLNRPTLKTFLILPCIGIIAVNMFLSNSRPAGGGNAFASIQQTSGGTFISDVNIRSSPSKKSNIVAKASRGHVVTIIGSSNEWYKVNYNGYEGFVKQKYVKR